MLAASAWIHGERGKCVQIVGCVALGVLQHQQLLVLIRNPDLIRRKKRGARCVTATRQLVLADRAGAHNERGYVVRWLDVWHQGILLLDQQLLVSTPGPVEEKKRGARSVAAKRQLVLAASAWAHGEKRRLDEFAECMESGILLNQQRLVSAARPIEIIEEGSQMRCREEAVGVGSQCQGTQEEEAIHDEY